MHYRLIPVSRYNAQTITSIIIVQKVIQFDIVLKVVIITDLEHIPILPINALLPAEFQILLVFFFLFVCF